MSTSRKEIDDSGSGSDASSAKRLLDLAINKMLEHINLENEDNALAILNVMHECYQITLSEVTLELEMSGNNVASGLLGFAAYKGLLRFGKRLIELGHSVDSRSVCKDNPIYDYLTPLMFACGNDKLEMCAFLLENKANLLDVDVRRNSIFIQIKSKEMLAFIINAAVKQNCLKELLIFKNKQNHTAIQQLCYNHDPQILEAFLDIIGLDNLSKYINVRDLLSLVRSKYFNRYNQSAAYENICRRLQPYVARTKVPTFPYGYFYPLDVAHNGIFGKNPLVQQSAKQKALRQALAQTHALFRSPAACLKYLLFINEEFSRYFEETHHVPFPAIDKTTYHFDVIDHLYFPTPNENYQPLNKKSSLQEYILLFLRHYGLAENTHKWMGYIPKQLTKDSLSRGDFFTEDRFGEGLFHNKITHMLQQMLILCAIEDKVIDLRYETPEGEKWLTVKDILFAMMTEKMVGEKFSLWMTIRDSRSDVVVSFGDPNRLGSFIMSEGNNLGMNALADSLIDTHCKGVRKLVAAYKETGGFADLTVQQFTDKMDDIQVATFVVNEYLLQYALKREKVKKNVVLATDNETYAVIEKQYHPNKNFKVKTYEPEDSKLCENFSPFRL